MEGVEELVEVASHPGQVAGELQIDRGYRGRELRTKNGAPNKGAKRKPELVSKLAEMLRFRR